MCSLVVWLVGAGLKLAPTGVEVFTVRVAPLRDRFAAALFKVVR